jgi:hypothetical protein
MYYSTGFTLYGIKCETGKYVEAVEIPTEG